MARAHCRRARGASTTANIADGPVRISCRTHTAVDFDAAGCVRAKSCTNKRVHAKGWNETRGRSSIFRVFSPSLLPVAASADQELTEQAANECRRCGANLGELSCETRARAKLKSTTKLHRARRRARHLVTQCLPLSRTFAPNRAKFENAGIGIGFDADACINDSVNECMHFLGEEKRAKEDKMRLDLNVLFSKSVTLVICPHPMPLRGNRIEARGVISAPAKCFLVTRLTNSYAYIILLKYFCVTK